MDSYLFIGVWINECIECGVRFILIGVEDDALWQNEIRHFCSSCRDEGEN
jgi:hypothetical protein